MDHNSLKHSHPFIVVDSLKQGSTRQLVFSTREQHLVLLVLVLSPLKTFEGLSVEVAGVAIAVVSVRVAGVAVAGGVSDVVGVGVGKGKTAVDLAIGVGLSLTLAVVVAIDGRETVVESGVDSRVDSGGGHVSANHR